MNVSINPSQPHRIILPLRHIHGTFPTHPKRMCAIYAKAIEIPRDYRIHHHRRQRADISKTKIYQTSRPSRVLTHLKATTCFPFSYTRPDGRKKNSHTHARTYAPHRRTNQTLRHLRVLWPGLYYTCSLCAFAGASPNPRGSIPSYGNRTGSECIVLLRRLLRSVLLCCEFSIQRARMRGEIVT